MANDVFIEFDDLDNILRIVKESAMKEYGDDKFVKTMIENIFFEIDKRLIAFEENYRIKSEIAKGQGSPKLYFINGTNLEKKHGKTAV